MSPSGRWPERRTDRWDRVRPGRLVGAPAPLLHPDRGFVHVRPDGGDDLRDVRRLLAVPAAGRSASRGFGVADLDLCSSATGP